MTNKFESARLPGYEARAVEVATHEGRVNLVVSNHAKELGIVLDHTDAWAVALAVLEAVDLPGALFPDSPEFEVAAAAKSLRRGIGGIAKRRGCEALRRRTAQAFADAAAEMNTAFEQIREADRRAKVAADIDAKVKAAAEQRAAERAAVDADAWELFKAANPDTRRQSFDKVNPRTAADFRRVARRSRQLAEARQ